MIQKRYDHEIERVRILRYLLDNGEKLSLLTQTQINQQLEYRRGTLYKFLYFLLGRGHIKCEQIGNVKLYRITEEGVTYLEACEHREGGKG